MDYILLISGIVLLLFSGDWLVKAGSNIAKKFKISPFIIGVTIISFGTSAPELFVSLSASISGNADIAMGNIIGSNIANIGLVLGLTAIIISIPISITVLKLDYPVLIISQAVFVFFMIDLNITRLEGAILVLMMLLYILFIVKLNKNQRFEEDNTKLMHPALSIFIILLSCVGLMAGSSLLVDGASNIAKNLGVSERVISITVIALGTSLPELVTSVIAAVRRELDISIGNIIGSNIFNVLMIGGISSIVRPLSVNPQMLEFDDYFFMGFAILLGLSFLPLKNPKITRLNGIIMLIGYIVYCALLFSK